MPRPFRIAASTTLWNAALLSALFTAVGWCGHVLSPDQAKVLGAWLKSHPDFRAATDADCGCDDDIAKIRTGYGGLWKPVSDYHPYTATGDFNGDGEMDFAIVVVSQHNIHDRYALIIFNGPCQAGGPHPSFFKRGLDLRYSGLFYGPPRPKPYRLVMGRFEAEGVAIIPHGASYRITYSRTR